MNILDTDALSHHMKMNSIGASIEASITASLESEFWITSISAFEMAESGLRVT